MTRPMHQDAAVTAVLRRTMGLLLLLLIFSFSSFPSVTAECSDKCTCNGEKVYCYRLKLDRIPDRIPPSTEELWLNDNHISEVKNGAFSNLSKLQTLFLERNKIENIENGVFNNLTSLVHLDLRSNQIDKLDLEMFKGLTKLNTLLLTDNMIREIPPGIFDSLTSLSGLYLDRNKIENIENGVFNNLRSLFFLSLSSNKIHKLDLKTFKGLTKLNTLILTDNMIRKIPPGIFNSLTSLRRLKLDKNPLLCDWNIIFFLNALKKINPSGVLWDDDPSCHFPVEMSVFNCTAPDVIVVPEIKTVSLGEQLQLSCKAVGDPEPFISWYKDEIELEHGQRVQVFQNNTLIISKVERTDGGQYKCVASNALGQKSFEAMVHVNGLAENGFNTMFGVIPYFIFIIIIIFVICVLYTIYYYYVSYYIVPCL